MDPKEKIEVSEVEKFLETYELHRIHSHIFERVATLIIAALGLIAALAWDEALRGIFEQLFQGEETILEKISYALVITVIATIVSVILGKLYIKRRKKD